MSTPSIRLLGSGGWIPTSKRETCCALVRDGNQALIIDAGTGLQRLVEQPDLLRGIECVDLLLTHFHLDHVVGLAYIPALNLPTPPRIFGPGKWLYDCSTRSVIETLCSQPLLSGDLSKIAEDILELNNGDFDIRNFNLMLRAQHHSVPTVGVRVGDAFTYCTDTSKDIGNAQLARGCQRLLHEAWYIDEAPKNPNGHTSARQAGELAAAAEVKELVTIHVNPGGDEEKIEVQAQAAFPESRVGTDLLLLE